MYWNPEEAVWYYSWDVSCEPSLALTGAAFYHKVYVLHAHLHIITERLSVRHLIVQPSWIALCMYVCIYVCRSHFNCCVMGVVLYSGPRAHRSRMLGEIGTASNDT